MKKILLILLCLLNLSPAARAEETKYAGLIVIGGPDGEATAQLLAGLEARDAKATFFLLGENLKKYPEAAENILELGHELGIQGYKDASMELLGRRSIGQSLNMACSLLPQGSTPVFHSAPGGIHRWGPAGVQGLWPGHDRQLLGCGPVGPAG